MTEFVIIPAFNECEKISSVINKAKSLVSNVVVVDDGSNDKTTSTSEEAGAKVLKHCVNLGKGAALKTGCDYAYMHGATKIVVMDADGQHKPEDIPIFLNGLKNHDIVFGYRKGSNQMPSVLKFGNYFINGLLNNLFKVEIRDSQSGYRAFTREAYKKVRWTASDYYMETEMIINTSKKQLKYSQVPIETIYSDKYKGTTVLDGVMIVSKMFAWRFLR